MGRRDWAGAHSPPPLNSVSKGLQDAFKPSTHAKSILSRNLNPIRQPTLASLPNPLRSSLQSPACASCEVVPARARDHPRETCGVPSHRRGANNGRRRWTACRKDVCCLGARDSQTVLFPTVAYEHVLRAPARLLFAMRQLRLKGCWT